MMKKLDTKEWAGYVDEIIANCATVEEVQDFVKSKLG
jgi:phosphoenolpyruvate-protein phosphotransferase (PTS system enzyme I)